MKEMIALLLTLTMTLSLALTGCGTKVEGSTGGSSVIEESTLTPAPTSELEDETSFVNYVGDWDGGERGEMSVYTIGEGLGLSIRFYRLVNMDVTLVSQDEPDGSWRFEGGGFIVHFYPNGDTVTLNVEDTSGVFDSSFNGLEFVFTRSGSGDSDATGIDGWLGTWVADTGESIEVTDVSEDGIVLVYNGLTASGESYFSTEYVLAFEDEEKTIAAEDREVVSERGWRYVFILHDTYITMQSRYPDQNFINRERGFSNDESIPDGAAEEAARLNNIDNTNPKQDSDGMYIYNVQGHRITLSFNIWDYIYWNIVDDERVQNYFGIADLAKDLGYEVSDPDYSIGVYSRFVDGVRTTSAGFHPDISNNTSTIIYQYRESPERYSGEKTLHVEPFDFETMTYTNKGFPINLDMIILCAYCMEYYSIHDSGDCWIDIFGESSPRISPY